MIHLLGTVGLYVGAVAALLFCVAYQLSATWWRSAEGRHLMSFTGAFALILIWLSWRTATSHARPLPHGEEIIRAAIYCSIAALMVWRFLLLGRKQIWASWRRSSRRERPWSS